MTAQCNVEIPPVEGLEEKLLTVGREFLLVCDGEFPKDFELEKLHFQLSPEQQYQIKLLNFELRSGSKADLKVTAYQTGTIKFKELTLTDGVKQAILGPLEYTVASVLPPKDPQNSEAPPEAYGAVGPATVQVPMLYWSILMAVIACLLLLLLTKIYRFIQRRNLLARLKEYDSAQTPIAQFHQSLRGLQRTNESFFGGKTTTPVLEAALTRSRDVFFLYLTRRFQVPAMEWGEKLILRDLKQYHPKMFKECSGDLKKLFNEFSKGFEDTQKLTETDIKNIVVSSRLLAEKMEACV